VSYRRRRRGYRLPPGKFAPIPVDLVKRAAGLLSAPEFRVWICLCAQSQLWSNGTANLTRSVIREFHLGSTRVVTSSIRKLIDAGLAKRTRPARQHVCAMFAVTHLPLNRDAMAKQGINVTTWEALESESSETNSGSAVARPMGKRYCDRMGSAEPPHTASARPQGNRNPPFSTLSARPQGNTSKTLPSGTEQTSVPDSAAAVPPSAPDSVSESDSSVVPIRARSPKRANRA
jgi:hypothetical protein